MVWLFSDDVLLCANASEGPAVRVGETTRALTASTLQVNSTGEALRQSVFTFAGKWYLVLVKSSNNEPLFML